MMAEMATLDQLVQLEPQDRWVLLDRQAKEHLELDLMVPLELQAALVQQVCLAKPEEVVLLDLQDQLEALGHLVPWDPLVAQAPQVLKDKLVPLASMEMMGPREILVLKDPKDQLVQLERLDPLVPPEILALAQTVVLVPQVYPDKLEQQDTLDHLVPLEALV